MSFMQAEIVQDDWIEIEGSDGSRFIPADLCGKLAETEDERAAQVRDYYDGREISSVTLHANKWGARLQAPGYMDCTDWSIYDSEREAKRELCAEHELCPICLESIAEPIGRNNSPACRFHHSRD